MNNENFWNLVNLFDGLSSIFIYISIIVTISMVGLIFIRDWIKNGK